jgi:acyl-[acyl-carrier-protein] desaturase
VLQSIEPAVGEIADKILRPAEDAANWQPTDLVPDPGTEEGLDALSGLRARAAELPEDLLLVTIGNLITEEALPTYQTAFNRHVGVNDVTGVDDTAWGRWSRAWTAEENRHGSAMSLWARFCGRIDMRSVEATIQRLLSNGFDVGTGNDPYEVLVFTSFQEQATLASHKNVAKQAHAAGDDNLGRICDLVGTDEARHTRFYKGAMRLVFEQDPDGALEAFANMMRKKIRMPAELMDDGGGGSVFEDYAELAQQVGIYTSETYVRIMETCNAYWRVETLQPLTEAGRKAQDYLGSLPGRYRRLAERRRARAVPLDRFRWLAAA